MLSTSGAELDAALAELGWADMLSDMPDLAIPLVFRLLGETGSHASVLNDVVLQTAGRARRDPSPALCRRRLGGVGLRQSDTSSPALGGLPLRRVDEGEPCGWPRPAGQWAGGWSGRPGRC